MFIEDRCNGSLRATLRTAIYIVKDQFLNALMNRAMNKIYNYGIYNYYYFFFFISMITHEAIFSRGYNPGQKNYNFLRECNLS